MYDERKTGCKEVPNILLKCGYGIRMLKFASLIAQQTKY